MDRQNFIPPNFIKMENKIKSYSERLQDELEPILHSIEHDESDDIEDAKKVIEKRKKKFIKEFLSDKKLADNLQKISNHKKSEHWQLNIK